MSYLIVDNKKKPKVDILKRKKYSNIEQPDMIAWFDNEIEMIKVKLMWHDKETGLKKGCIVLLSEDNLYTYPENAQWCHWKPHPNSGLQPPNEDPKDEDSYQES